MHGMMANNYGFNEILKVCPFIPVDYFHAVVIFHVIVLSLMFEKSSARVR